MPKAACPGPLAPCDGKGPAFPVTSGLKISNTPSTRTEENVPPRLFADEFQTQDIPIERLGPVQIIDVEGRFEKVLNAVVAHFDLLPCSSSQASNFSRSTRLNPTLHWSLHAL